MDNYLILAYRKMVIEDSRGKNIFYSHLFCNTISLSKDNAVARKRLRRCITDACPQVTFRLFRLYVEEADDDVNKVNQRPGAHPARERIVNKVFTLPVITTCKVVTYK